jgi:alginate O-acetyltransferase complex protein AlgI
MFVVGLVKKVIIADSIALFTDGLWTNVTDLNSIYAWAAVLGYTFQLYFDFSGYSDMAIGLGRLFGLNFARNFNSPYKAVNIADFWRRWHISLSTWLRDYLYIPLGGSRLGNARTYINLLLTMLLGGLWHGASWTFVAWGGYHGALLSLYKIFGKKYDLLPVFVQRTSTFFAITIGWVFFRSPTFAAAWTMLKKMFGFNQPLPDAVFAAKGMAALFLLLISCVLITNFFPNSYQWPYSKKPRFAIMLAAAAVLSLIFMNYKQNVFLYYQF